VDEDSYTDAEKNFAAEVAEERKKRGWTLAEMAEKLEAAGVPAVSVMTVSRIENKKRHVTMVEAQAYSTIFDRSMANLMHPDGRETIFRMLKGAEIPARKSYVRLKEAAREFGEHQGMVETHIPAVLDLYADNEDIPVDIRAALVNYLQNAKQFVHIDAATEVAEIIRAARKKHGQHPTAP
jgi:transcriptional regulator with XRE-family HTH domain